MRQDGHGRTVTPTLVTYNLVRSSACYLDATLPPLGLSCRWAPIAMKRFAARALCPDVGHASFVGRAGRSGTRAPKSWDGYCFTRLPSRLLSQLLCSRWKNVFWEQFGLLAEDTFVSPKKSIA